MNTYKADDRVHVAKGLYWTHNNRLQSNRNGTIATVDTWTITVAMDAPQVVTFFAHDELEAIAEERAQ